PPSSGTLHTFTTLPEAREGLPDGRAWELVSPPDKGGASIEPIGGISPVAAPSIPTVQASEDGNAIAYGANAPIESNPEGNRSPESQEVFSTRGAAAWSSREIVTPFLRGE